MKLFDLSFGPNPRRVRIFLAEKGISVPLVPVDLTRGEQFSPEFRAVNPDCRIPALVLEDGTLISEVLAIWRYFEEIQPEPALLGRTPLEKAQVTMWERWAELDGFLAAIEAFRNLSPSKAGWAVAGRHAYEQIPALAARGRARTLAFFADLDERLQGVAYVAGDAFSAADITAAVTVEFAAARMGLAVGPELAAVHAWFGRVTARASWAA